MSMLKILTQRLEKIFMGYSLTFFGIDDAIIASALIGGGTSLWGASSAKKSAEKTNEQQIGLAQAQMDFQERMRSTAHQVEVQDLLKAGLNPILSANSGAPMAMGAMPSLTVPGQSYGNIGEKVNSAIGNAISSAKAAADIKSANAQTNLLDRTTAKMNAEIDSAQSDAEIKDIEAQLAGMKLRYYKDHPDTFGLKMEGEGFNMGNLPAILAGSAKGIAEAGDSGYPTSNGGWHKRRGK